LHYSFCCHCLHGCTGLPALPGILRIHPTRCWSGIAGRSAGGGPRIRSSSRLDVAGESCLHRWPRWADRPGAGMTIYCTIALLRHIPAHSTLLLRRRRRGPTYMRLHPPSSPRLIPAVARCSRAPGTFKLGRSYGWAGSRAGWSWIPHFTPLASGLLTVCCHITSRAFEKALELIT
jgi:hypothetical protein